MEIITTIWNFIKDNIDTFESMGVLTASIFACISLNQWKKEITGRRKIELAEEAVDMFSQFSNAIYSIRSGFYRATEGQTLVQNGETHQFSLVVLERIQKQNELLNRIDSIRYRFLAYFGKDNDKLFKKNRQLLVKIKSAAHMLMSTSSEDLAQLGKDTEKEYKNTLQRKDFDETDDIQKEAEKIRDEMVAICTPYLNLK